MSPTSETGIPTFLTLALMAGTMRTKSFWKIFLGFSNIKLETFKTYFLSSTDNLYYLLSCNNSLLEYLSLHAHPNLSQFEKFVGCTHDYLREQTELVSNLQERITLLRLIY